MNKILKILLFTFVFSQAKTQNSEDFIPKDAVTVFSINNISLLKKVSLDELIRYDFMAEIQAELFDGSTSGKTIKDSGIDFDKKLNVFYGVNENHEVAGFTFGIKDKIKLFSVFDDYEKRESLVKGVELYSSFFNHLIIKDNIGIVLRVDPTYEKVSVICDSIWLARGFGYFNDGIDNAFDENFIEGDDFGNEVIAEEIIDDDLNKSFSDTITMNEYDILNKTYWEMRDSVTNELQFEYFKQIYYEIFQNNIHLKNQDVNFEKQLNNPSDGVFYIDNSRNFKNAKGLWHFQTMFPELYSDMKELYTGNVILGDINLNQNQININFDANYGESLGKIYQKLNGVKFDKNVLKYIHQNSMGYFTYNINLKEGYNKAYDIMIPILREEKDPRITSNVLMAELINEFVNIDAVFDTYKGSMFGSFNGIKSVKTKKIEFFYDENTFEYGEKEIEGKEDMPVFTLGFSTNRSDIPEKVLKHFSKMTSRFQNLGNYWLVEDAIFNSIPMYIINQNGLLIFTNDEDLAKNNNGGYGANSLKGKAAKVAKKSKFMYAYFDWGIALNKVPKEVFSLKQNEILDALRGKTGKLELTSSKTTVKKTSFKLNYSFEGNYDNSGKYLLDLINSIYVLSK
jgi:hypothetical protein